MTEKKEESRAEINPLKDLLLFFLLIISGLAVAILIIACILYVVTFISLCVILKILEPIARIILKFFY